MYIKQLTVKFSHKHHFQPILSIEVLINHSMFLTVTVYINHYLDRLKFKYILTIINFNLS